MPQFPEFFSTLREQMQSTASRSDILKPSAWLIVILLGGIGSFFYLKAPDWALIAEFALLGLVIALYLFSYMYCLFSDKDALRSEKYVINKMAIERGIFGDSSTGIIDQPPQPALISTKPAGKIEFDGAVP